MIFGKIEYLNLLPFHIFMKRFTKGHQHQIMEYKRSVPSTINRAFHTRRVDGAFISSITANKSAHVSLGIIAQKEVKSVIVIPSKSSKADKASATSNRLASILNVEGEVLIGDRALRYALQNSDYIDLVSLWHERYKLPFVFALLCFHKERTLYKKIEREFLKQRVKIPQYMLKRASQKAEINEKDILEYLKLISYKLDYRAQKGLKKFLDLAI